VVVLPGTKTTVADLQWLRRTRLAERVVGLAAAGSAVLGICGGYQMLGRRLLDPEGVESPDARDVPGLALLPVETTFLPHKTTRQVRGEVLAAAGPLAGARGAPVTAYEIHMGQTSPVGNHSEGQSPGDALGPAFRLQDGREDGATGADGRVVGTYLHGVLDNAPVRRALLSWAAARNGRVLGPRPEAEDDPEASLLGASLDRLAGVLRQTLNLPTLYRIVGLTP
jgi:adenosylcobyric acid synthase